MKERIHSWRELRCLSITGTKITLLAFLPFLTFGFVTNFMNLPDRLALSPRLVGFLVGAALFLPAWQTWRKFAPKSWQFVCTLEHEITHAAVGLVFLFIPTRMSVSAGNGGHVMQRWVGPNWLCPLYAGGRVLSSLAPYYLPTGSYLLVGLSFVVPASSTLWLSIVLGFVTVFHVVSNWAETDYRQPDIREAGVIFSMIILPLANVIAFGGIVAFVVAGPRGFTHLWTNGLAIQH